ncbi:MAG: glycoside hydrolase family 97 catalytic domain-containing protein [Bacteroidales bacterium]|nr:glycoside hydrolase family 97 catalytic domain-containing protein [Bacteroidales bacterium]
MKHLFPAVLLSVFFIACTAENDSCVNSPDGTITLSLELTEEGKAYYYITRNDSIVLENSMLGLLREDADFTNGLILKAVSDVNVINDNYILLYGKKRIAAYHAHQKVYHLENSQGEKMDIIFQVSDDGVAFRYFFPRISNDKLKIVEEKSSFNFPANTKAWIQPRASSKSGWNQVNPSYEEHYLSDCLLNNVPASDSGWVLPALFHHDGCWIHITETWPERNYCGCHLQRNEDFTEYTIAFPEVTEGFADGPVYPESALPWATPWRVITMGDDPGDIIESTLGTDVAKPTALKDISYVRPGRASWSWALMKDPSVNYDTQKEFIDYASEMHWEYCLIDVNWDAQIGWDKIKELARYAREKNVGLILWYNSAGNWNTVSYTPKDIFLTSETRQSEFQKLKEAGIKGIKVDFFGGDGQSMMDYYIDILEDAHKFRLMVNCHGATIPRGLHRTYPNLVSMESVRGFEYATFEQRSADKLPKKITILPFTRNTFDPMDFTPVCFNEYDHNTRVTGNGAELAQTVLLLSGVQHYAEIPSGMKMVPDYVQQMMREIPVDWDETRFVDGYPGEYLIIARRKNQTWYVAGINGEVSSKDLTVFLPFMTQKRGILISEHETLRSFRKEEIQLDEQGKYKISLLGYGGFLLIFNTTSSM